MNRARDDETVDGAGKAAGVASTGILEISRWQSKIIFKNRQISKRARRLLGATSPACGSCRLDGS